jgi:type I restriction enzyme S subunit
VRPGDIVISLTGTVGKEDYANVCILGYEYESYYLNQRNAKLELCDTLDSYYLTNILRILEIKRKQINIDFHIKEKQSIKLDLSEHSYFTDS